MVLANVANTKLSNGEKQGVDSRDQVRHSEKTYQLFVKMTIEADGKK